MDGAGVFGISNRELKGPLPGVRGTSPVSATRISNRELKGSSLRSCSSRWRRRISNRELKVVLRLQGKKIVKPKKSISNRELKVAFLDAASTYAVITRISNRELKDEFLELVYELLKHYGHLK